MLFTKRHKCVVAGCLVDVEASHLMCHSHWSMVNPGLQTLYWRMHHAGQPRDGFEEVCENIVMQVQEIVDTRGRADIRRI